MSLRYNLASGKGPGLNRFGQEPPVWALYKPTSLCESYMAGLPEWVHLRLITTWFGQENRTPLSEGMKTEIDRISDQAVEQAEEVAGAHGIKVSGRILAQLREVSRCWFDQVACDLSRARRALSGSGPIHFLGVSGGNHYSRILSLAVQEKGGTVTGFNHGFDTCRYLRDYSLLEFSCCDQFVVENSNIIGLFEKTLEAYPSPLKKPIRFTAVGHDAFVSLWESYKQQPPPTKVRRVMVIGACYRGDLCIFGVSHDLTWMDLERRAMLALMKAGYEVLYKRHPSAILGDQTIELFPPDVRLINEPFETVMDQADAFLFLTTQTTTLGAALCTNKPIVFIHGGVESWFEEPLKLFGRRAHVVSGGYDERNRITFDEEALLQGLEDRPSEYDDQFLRTYFLPDGFG